ncbi:MAG: hypothetical protein PHN44_00715 [Candidatus Marinimicrobia bacterium]|nr:hypothetical protein [Candidatus Neomarinimicrobiota bacterium]MDD5539112.1 hypothetical protein [Candidatus Neomarinimicrobiota bacterium]
MAFDETTLGEMYTLLRQLAGGAVSLQSLADDFAAELDLAKDPLIGTAGLLLDGTEQTIYEHDGEGIPFKFEGGFVDLSTLIATDTVIIRVYATSGDGVNLQRLTIDAANTYTGVVDPPQITIPDVPPCSYVVRVTIECTAHVAFKTVYPHFYDAVRGS